MINTPLLFRPGVRVLNSNKDHCSDWYLFTFNTFMNLYEDLSKVIENVLVLLKLIFREIDDVEIESESCVVSIQGYLKLSKDEIISIRSIRSVCNLIGFPFAGVISCGSSDNESKADKVQCRFPISFISFTGIGFCVLNEFEVVIVLLENRRRLKKRFDGVTEKLSGKLIE